MYRMRSWSVRNARWLKRAYEGFETVLVWLSPLLRRIGYERLDKPFAAVEKMTKGVLLDSQNCGQCIVGFTETGNEVRLGAGLGGQQALPREWLPHSDRAAGGRQSPGWQICLAACGAAQSRC
jgi:hypothetical protein